MSDSLASRGVTRGASGMLRGCGCVEAPDGTIEQQINRRPHDSDSAPGNYPGPSPSDTTGHVGPHPEVLANE
jgi:hypothetical protein